MLTEREKIAAVLAGFDPLRVSQGEADAEVIALPAGHSVAITSDQLNARHCAPQEALSVASRRATVESLSDLAAVGADVIGVQVDLRIPANICAGCLTDIGRGIDDALRLVDGKILQASNMSSGEFLMSTTSVGCVPGSGHMSRHGVGLGELICVSGVPGRWNSAHLAGMFDEGVVGLGDAVEAHWFAGYEPRIAYGKVLAGSGLVSACSDMNDCFLKVLRDILRVNDLGWEMTNQPTPSPGQETIAELCDVAVTDLLLGHISGDDELLFTVAREHLAPLNELLAAADLPEPAVIGVTADARQEDLEEQPSGFVGELYPHHYRTPSLLRRDLRNCCEMGGQARPAA